MFIEIKSSLANFIKFDVSSLVKLFLFFSFIDCLIGLKLRASLTNYGYDQSIAYKFLPIGEKRQLQKQMLSLLGLDHRPKPKRKDLFSSLYLQDLYQSFIDKETFNSINDDNPIIVEGEVLSEPSVTAINEADVIVGFINQYDLLEEHLKNNKNHRLWFDTSEILPESNVIRAELRLFRNFTHFPTTAFDIFKVDIFTISTNNNDDEAINLIDSKTFSHKGGWLMFNVTSAIQDWVNNPDNNSGLFLTVHSSSTGKELEPKDIGIIGSGEIHDRQPFILSFFKNSQSHKIHRSKRGAKQNQREEVSSYKAYRDYNPYYDLMPGNGGQSCQIKSLYVSFKDLGWQDWIIAPDGYAAFFCDGECKFPLNAHMNATNHAIVQTLVHLMNPASVPKPCCAPTKLTSISVLYFDDNSNVIFKKYKNMVVKSCGCH